MKNILLTSVYFLFLSCCGHTNGKCMNDDALLENDVELSWKHSLISGFKFDDDKEKAAITVGIKPPTKVSKPHAYLVFEYYKGLLYLPGVDLTLPKGQDLSMWNHLPSQADSNIRSEREVREKFVGYNKKEKKCCPRYEKVVSFIVTKKQALAALKEAEEGNPEYILRGNYILNARRSDKEKVFNCITYVFHILEKAGIDLLKGKNFFIADVTDLRKSIASYQPPKEITKLNPSSAQILFSHAQEIEKKRIADRKKRETEEQEEKNKKHVLAEQEKNAAWWKKVKDVAIAVCEGGVIGAGVGGGVTILVWTATSIGQYLLSSGFLW